MVLIYHTHGEESDKIAVVNNLKTEIQFECQTDLLLLALLFFTDGFESTILHV